MDAIACKIDPLQEMGNFVAADAEDDLKDFRAGGFLAQRSVEAGAALFDVSEVEDCSVGNHLYVGGGAIEIRVSDGDG